MANFYIKHTLILTIATYQYKTVSVGPIHHIDMKNMYMYVCMYECRLMYVNIYAVPAPWGK